MAEFEFNGHAYQLATIDAMTQMHIARRLMPVMGALGEGGIPGVFKAVGQMPDADFEYIIGKCLTGCMRKNGDTWAKVWASGNLMFADIGPMGITRIAVETIKENMGDFFPALASVSGQPAV